MSSMQQQQPRGNGKKDRKDRNMDWIVIFYDEDKKQLGWAGWLLIILLVAVIVAIIAGVAMKKRKNSQSVDGARLSGQTFIEMGDLDNQPESGD